MVSFGGGEHLLWRAVNIDYCRLGVVSRAQRERQLTVTVAVTATVLPLSFPYKDGVAHIWGPIHCVCAYMRVCLPLSVSLCGCMYTKWFHDKAWCPVLSVGLHNFVFVCTLQMCFHNTYSTFMYLHESTSIFVCVCMCD